MRADANSVDGSLTCHWDVIHPPNSFPSLRFPVTCAHSCAKPPGITGHHLQIHVVAWTGIPAGGLWLCVLAFPAMVFVPTVCPLNHIVIFIKWQSVGKLDLCPNFACGKVRRDGSVGAGAAVGGLRPGGERRNKKQQQHAARTS